MMLIDAPAPPTFDPSLDNSTLVARLTGIAHTERELRSDFIAYLAAFDDRRAYLELAFPTTFAWLTEALHFPKATAFRRITAARLHARMPAVGAYVREGRLSLTKLCLLKDVLAPDNCLALLEQAAAMTEKQVEELAVILDPSRKPAPPRDSIRPVAPAPSAAPQPDLFAAGPSVETTTPTAPPQPRPSAPGSTTGSPPPELRHVIKMTVGAGFMTLLEEVRAEMSHSHPGASLEVLLSECMKVALATRRKRSRAQTIRPLPRTAEPVPGSRDVPADVRRAVWKRDGARCTFVSADGRRCSATHRLQLHHEEAYGRGGPATVANIRLLCDRHNDLMARREYGDDLMNHYTNRHDHCDPAGRRP